MRGIVELWLSQLYRLTVLWPAWLLTPEGLRRALTPRMLWRIALMLVVAAAVSAMLRAGLPPDLAVVGSGDLLAYLDVAVIAWAAGAGALVKSAAAWVKRQVKPGPTIAARRGRQTATRRRGRQRLPPPANDDGSPGERWTVAA